MIKTIVDGVKPIHTPEEAAEWEAHRERGFFYWRMRIGFFVAAFSCLWGSAWFLIGEVAFRNESFAERWFLGFVIQNFTFFFCGFMTGYYLSRGMWEDKEEYYQEYVKKLNGDEPKTEESSKTEKSSKTENSQRKVNKS